MNTITIRSPDTISPAGLRIVTLDPAEEVSKFAPDHDAAVAALNKRITDHNVAAAKFVADIETLGHAARIDHKTAPKLAATLPARFMELSATAVAILADKIEMRQQLNAVYTEWKKTVLKQYNVEEKRVRDTALATLPNTYEGREAVVGGLLTEIRHLRDWHPKIITDHGMNQIHGDATQYSIARQRLCYAALHSCGLAWLLGMPRMV